MARRGKLSSELEIRAGDILAEKYRAEALLGVGGMGVVLRATHLVLKDRVALKVLQKGAGVEAAERFFREAQAAARIKSPHVARVIDVGRLPSGPFLVMEYLEGRDLGRVLQEQGPLPVEEAARYVLETCEALAAAHALGVIHRDIKPSNLFLSRETDGTLTIKVVDFGVSKQTRASEYSSLTEVQTAIGTPSYMSPEQVKSSKHVDARSDIWSLGVVLYELLAKRLPFDADSLAGLVAMLVDPSVSAPSIRDHRADVPEELEAVILRCLEKDPADRFADVAELASAVSPFAGPEGVVSAARSARILTSSATGLEPPPESTDVGDEGDTAPRIGGGPDTATSFSSTRWPRSWRRGLGQFRKYALPASFVALIGFWATLWKLGSSAPTGSGSAPVTREPTVAPPAPVASARSPTVEVAPVEAVRIQDLPVDRETRAPVPSAALPPAPSARPASSAPSARPIASVAPPANDDLANPYELMIDPYR